MDNQDYLTDYRLFFDNFYQSFEMDNPLPVHIGKYNVAEFEIVGEVICWCLEYLNIRKCPSSLIAPLCRSVIVELEEVIRRDPESCGYRSKEDDYQTLKLMQVTIKKLNEVCLRYRDNSEVSRLPPPPPVSPSVSAAAVKNSRRTMEDCHIVIHDLHALFGIEGYGVASYYAVFDGHIGSDAALYSCSHIYQYLVESPYYPTNPEAAFKEAFIKTDERFIDKSNKENLKSGTTAVCILIRHDLGKMYVAWLGDSQAILVNGRDYIQLVNPHRPEQLEEKERIEAMGGSVVFWGTWRVNGQLAVSRAIGDVDYKPYVTAEPDVTSYDLSGDEDFLLLACDGLWDVISEKHAVEEVYKCLELHKGDRSRVSQSLVQAAKSLGSKDNISVVVAWLDMSTLENGHFAPGSEVDSVDDLLLPPVLRSLKPTTQTIAPPGDDSGDVGGEGESGDDSDEEWNYISGKENREPNQHTKQELTREEMESQLNPNAAEFVPGYGAISPTSDLDIVDISRSPKRSEIKNLDNVVVPTSKEFLKEISKRPSDLDELGENETTLNGGDLNNLSTKAVFGDDSVCHNSVIDSSLQNESLKSTNPFASSQVPNFVQDHFSLPDDSKANDEYDFMGNSGKIDLSPSAPALDVYTSGQTDLTGVTFGDGVNVDEIVRSKQDSPLLRESPEPSLHNGQLEHNYHQKEDDKTQGLQIASVETVRWPSDSQEDVDKQVITNLTTEALMHSDHGPETSVDSESDEDLVLSPKMKENLNISTQLADESVPIEDPVCSLKPSHDTDLIEKSSVPVPQLEEVNVFHKDDEDGEEELTCPNKHHSPENSSNLVPEESVGDAHLSEKVSAVISPDVPSDFEIVHSDNFGCTFQTNNTEMESPKEAGNAVDDLPYHADPVEEIIRKEEVHEDLICPVKESQLLQEDSKEPEQSADEFSFEKIVAEESSTPQGGIKLHELVPELEDVNGKHMNNIFQFQDETMCFRRKDEVEDTCINKEEELMESLEKDELICPKKMEVCRDEQRVAIDSVEEDLVCPIKKDVNDDGAFKNEMHFLSSVTKDLDGLQLKEDKDFDSSNKKEELFCPIEKQDDKFVCQTEKENDLICPDEEKSELVVCPIQKEDELGFSTKKEEDLVCPMNKADFTEYLRKEEDDLTSTLRKEEDDLTSYLRKEEDNLTCSLRKKEDDLTSYLRKEEDVLASSLRKEEDFASSVNKEEDLVCPIIKKEENSLFSIPKEDNIYYHSNQVEDACFFGKDDSLQKNKENVFSVKGDEVLNQELRSSESVQVCSLRSDEESVCPPPNDSVTSQPKEFVSSQNEECVRSFTEEVICSLRKGKDEISNIEDIKPEIQMSQEICEQFSVETQENHEISSEISVKSPLTKDILPEDNLIYSEQSTEESLDNLEEARENKVVKQEESIDEMSSSMIDHGEDKSLPEAQSSQLDLVQDLQFEIQEKAEVDTESDSGFEIINASEASTIEMEMRIQSEKEAGAADEKLHLDKNEAEIPEKVEADVTDRYQSEVIEESGRKDLEPLDTKKAMDEVLVNGSAGTADTPATPPATPAPGLQVESKEGLIAAAVAAAGVATAVAAGSAAVAVTESKVEEKKKPPTPKKAEPLTKSAPPSKAPPSKTLSGKPAAPSKAPAAPSKAPAASKAPSSSLKAAPKPSSPSAKTAPTATKPAPGSKPSTPTSKVAAKPGSKPSTPTGPKPAPATALKSKPATSAPLKSTTASSLGAKPPAPKVGPVGGPKPAPAAATKKPAPTPAPKPTSTASKSAVSSSSVAARPAAKPATESKSVISSTQKSPATKMAPAKPPTPTTGKAPISARPPSAKTAAPSKPPVSSAPSKAPATKPPPIRAPTAKAPSTITAKTTTATKPLAPAKPTAPTKTASAPLNKKPAAPTAIKKPAAPTDKSVKEANNKLASAKTGIKKVDEKKVINKKEEIAENEVLLTQEPVVTTTNGHISLIENGIPSPEIVADSN